jgi:hypothetical protein
MYSFESCGVGEVIGSGFHAFATEFFGISLPNHP